MSNYEEIMRKRQEQFKKQNSYIKDNYKKLTTTLKMDIYNQVISKYNGTEIDGKKWSMNKYITNLILVDLEKDEKPIDVPETTYITTSAPKKMQPKPKQKKPAISDEEFEIWLEHTDFSQAVDITNGLTDAQYSKIIEKKKSLFSSKSKDNAELEDIVTEKLKEIGISEEISEQTKQKEENPDKKIRYIEDPYNPNKIIEEDYYKHRDLQSIIEKLPIDKKN